MRARWWVAGVQSRVMKTSEIITLVIAAWGAVLSTISIAWQLSGDRVKVKVTAKRSRKIIGSRRYDGMLLTIVEVTNVGRRPVTITSIGAINLYPHHHFVVTDTIPALPCEITEGKYISAMLDQADLDFSIIDYWNACDSHGRGHNLREATLFKHWKSWFQSRRAWRKKESAKYLR